MTLALVDLHCATNVFPELCTLGFLQPSGLRSLPVCLWKVGVLHDSFCSWSRGTGRARRTRCSAFAESQGVIASAAERHDLTLMQPLHSGSAFTLSSATFAVLDLRCEPK